MCDDQFDTSPKMRKLFEEKQKQRLAAKKYFQNLLYSPYRIPGGMPFDPALHRYCAMSAYHIENYVPKAKHYLSFFVMYFGVPSLFAWMYHIRNKKSEYLIRSGQVKYEDRRTYVL